MNRVQELAKIRADLTDLEWSTRNQLYRVIRLREYVDGIYWSPEDEEGAPRGTGLATDCAPIVPGHLTPGPFAPLRDGSEADPPAG